MEHTQHKDEEEAVFVAIPATDTTSGAVRRSRSNGNKEATSTAQTHNMPNKKGWGSARVAFVTILVVLGFEAATIFYFIKTEEAANRKRKIEHDVHLGILGNPGDYETFNFTLPDEANGPWSSKTRCIKAVARGGAVLEVFYDFPDIALGTTNHPHVSPTYMSISVIPMKPSPTVVLKPTSELIKKHKGSFQHTMEADGEAKICVRASGATNDNHMQFGLNATIASAGRPTGTFRFSSPLSPCNNPGICGGAGSISSDAKKTMSKRNNDGVVVAEAAPVSFSCLTEELLLNVAEFLPAKDLLQFQCVSSELASLKTDSIWKQRCRDRWAPWPRFQLTSKREEELNRRFSSSDDQKSWKVRYQLVEQQATCTELTLEDLQNLQWYLSFIISGVHRGETNSQLIPIQFCRNNHLMMMGHPPLPYQIICDTPPPSDHIRSGLRGDRPFSNTQYLQISEFPAHFITRKKSNAEWMIVNENVLIVSTGKRVWV
ncbi:expressed unknown protein [Seminavis robusta]|uniref:F-box domain-containing protein n=1 Tax=Seminavis robusta TaxID=568900 RepID=A0A9N8DVD4_9STRA|nr:expressed unknown protein [Seminavis robusta]|eukprot:Sro380_g130550.1 n/a (488) ;mRNA; f:5907-7679